jgi:hypothetical protein
VFLPTMLFDVKYVWTHCNMFAVENNRFRYLVRKDDPDSLVGRRVVVYWAGSNQAYKATITKYTSGDRKHETHYDDNDYKDYDFSVKRGWRLLPLDDVCPEGSNAAIAVAAGKGRPGSNHHHNNGRSSSNRGNNHHSSSSSSSNGRQNYNARYTDSYDVAGGYQSVTGGMYTF